MKNHVFTAFAVLLFATAAAFAEIGQDRRAPPSDAASNRVLVEAFSDTPDDEIEAAAKVMKGRKVGRVRGTNFYIIELPVQASATAAAATAKKMPGVRGAIPDTRRAPQFVPNDPSLGSAWHLNTIGAPAAWDQASGEGVIMAVCDTGVDPHPDLDLVPGWNTYDNNSNSADVHGHGTKVAGSVAMLGNNGVGGAGIAYKTKIMPIRVSDPNGWAYDSSIASCITWAADNGAKGANASYAVCSSPVVQQAAAYMRSKGGVVTISAGNGGSETVSNSTNLTCVSATDSGDNKTSWSSFGVGVDVAAPGDNVFTTTKGGGYGGASGTSFSAPVTLGVYALMMSANPSLPPDSLDKLLYSSAKDLGAAGFDTWYGNGRVDAAAAVVAAKGNVPPPVDATPPSVAFSSPANGATVSGVVNVVVNASDNVRVAKVELSINGRIVAAADGSTLGYAWDTCPAQKGKNRKACGGTSSLSAKATDAAGNSATATVTVTVVRP